MKNDNASRRIRADRMRDKIKVKEAFLDYAVAELSIMVGKAWMNKLHEAAIQDMDKPNLNQMFGKLLSSAKE